MSDAKASSVMGTNHSLAYRKDIDGLRAIAVLSVLIFHINSKWLPGGFTGVDVFFVISGFLITSIISRDIVAGEFSFLDFYKRRITRLYPALLTVLGATLLAAWFLLYSEELKALAEHVIYSLLYAINFKLHSETGYFDTSADFKPLLHLWSLSIEEQFYFLFPIALFAFRNQKKHLQVALILFFASLGINLYFNITQITSPFYLSPARFWQIGFGSLIALAPAIVRNHFQSRSIRYSSLGLVAILIAITMTEQSNLNPTLFALVPVLGAGLIILAGGHRGFVVEKILSSPPVVFIGLISYPLYLWHWPILSLLRITVPEGRSVWLDISAGFLSIGLATATYLWIERPLRFQRRFLGRNAAVLFATSVCTIVVAQVIFHNEGFKERTVNAKAQEVRAQMVRLPAKSDVCIDEVGKDAKLDYCLYSKVSSERRLVALIGDSHAHAIYPGFAKYFEGLNTSLILLANSSCPMLLDVDTEENQAIQAECEIKKREILSYIESNRRISAVIIANRGVSYIERKGFGPAEPTPMQGIRSRLSLTKGSNPAELFSFGMQRLIDRLVKRKVSVYYFLQTPEVGLDPDQCVQRRSLFGDSSSPYCHRRLQDVLKHHSEYRSAVFGLKHLNGIIDPIPEVCRNEVCKSTFNDNVIYADDDHLNPDGAILIVEGLRTQMNQFFKTSIN